MLKPSLDGYILYITGYLCQVYFIFKYLTHYPFPFFKPNHNMYISESG